MLHYPPTRLIHAWENPTNVVGVQAWIQPRLIKKETFFPPETEFFNTYVIFFFYQLEL